MTAVVLWFQGFAITAMVVGAICVVAGAYLYGLTDMILDIMKTLAS